MNKTLELCQPVDFELEAKRRLRILYEERAKLVEEAEVLDEQLKVVDEKIDDWTRVTKGFE